MCTHLRARPRESHAHHKTHASALIGSDSESACLLSWKQGWCDLCQQGLNIGDWVLEPTAGRECRVAGARNAGFASRRITAGPTLGQAVRHGARDQAAHACSTSWSVASIICRLNALRRTLCCSEAFPAAGGRK